MSYIEKTVTQLRSEPHALWTVMYYCLQTRLDYWLQLMPPSLGDGGGAARRRGARARRHLGGAAADGAPRRARSAAATNEATKAACRRCSRERMPAPLCATGRRSRCSSNSSSKRRPTYSAYRGRGGYRRTAPHNVNVTGYRAHNRGTHRCRAAAHQGAPSAAPRQSYLRAARGSTAWRCSREPSPQRTA